MMRTGLLFLFLCLLLLCGNDNTHASLRADVDHYARFETTTESLSVAVVSFIHHETINAAFPEDSPLYLTCEDLEDDDTDNVFSRRFKTLAPAFHALFHFTVVSNHCNSTKVSPSLSAQTSCKYILQRVLRV